MNLAAVQKKGDPQVLDLGMVPFREAWALQKAAQAALIAGQGPEQVFLCEHPAVITIGRSGDEAHVRCSEAELVARGIEVIPIERGGDVTFHGPGQLVVYPILDLRTRRQDVSWFLRTLEQTIIDTLSDFGVGGLRYPSRTGVWTVVPEGITESPIPAKKIASIGVRLSRWCSLHGLSLNVGSCEDGFRLIDPCGYRDIVTTSIAEELAAPSAGSQPIPSMAKVKQVFVTKFGSQFNRLAPNN